MARPDAECTLYVDLDGTLVATDSLHEAALQLVRSDPLNLFRMMRWIGAGKAQFKQKMAQQTRIDASLLPYRTEVVDLIQAAKTAGRRVVLATASDRQTAEDVAAHLGLFDSILCSDGTTNLAGEEKLRAIRADAEQHGTGIHYAGNATPDLAIWEACDGAIVVSSSKRLTDRAESHANVKRVVSPPNASIRDYLYGMRLHQWAKNLLIGLPLLPILGTVTGSMLWASLTAFVAFGLTASSVYILNDLADLQADRTHHRKRNRPFAAGIIDIPRAMLLCGSLLIGGITVSLLLMPPYFSAALIFYVILTKAYSFGLKRKVLVDIFTLALLYTLRIIAGALAIQVTVSFWILCFSLFIFVSLALAKRYTELSSLAAKGNTNGWARGYSTNDRDFVLISGVASGHVAALVFCLYLNDPGILQRYQHPKALWMLAPLMFFWITRVWLMAQRGQLHDDPIVFAIRDRISRLICLMCAACYAVAVWAPEL